MLSAPVRGLMCEWYSSLGLIASFLCLIDTYCGCLFISEAFIRGTPSSTSEGWWIATDLAGASAAEYSDF